MFVYDCGGFTLFPTGKFMLTINDGTGNFSLSYLSMILHTFSGRIGSTGFIWSLRKSAIASLKLAKKGKER